MDIINKFPTAREVREGACGLFTFEQELKEIRKQILEAESKGIRSILIKCITPKIYDFLSDRGYKIDLCGIFWRISW